jgi:chaperonin cofactor prefoldin
VNWRGYQRRLRTRGGMPMADIRDDTEQAMCCRLACKQLERIVADARTLKGTGRALLVTQTEKTAGELYRTLRRLGAEVEGAATLDQVAHARRRVDRLDDELIRAMARRRLEVIRRSCRGGAS